MNGEAAERLTSDTADNMQTNIEPPVMPAEANDSRTASDEAVVLQGMVRSLCECANWCRGIVPEKWYGRTRDGIPLITNHHPNCPHYNDSLIDVWKMTVNGVAAYTDNAQDIEDWKQEEFEDETTITQEKMHREIFEHLPEFEGF